MFFTQVNNINKFKNKMLSPYVNSLATRTLMWFFHHSWSWATQWGFMLASQLWHSRKNLNLRCLLGHMGIMTWVPFRWVFSFRVESSTDSLCCLLMLVMVFAFCTQVPMLLPCSPMGVQLFRFAMPQSYGVYPCQAIVPPWNGLWPMLGVH